MAELRPDLVKEAKRLRRRSPKTGGQRSLREVSAGLVGLGYLKPTDAPFRHHR